jgi:hypothetical protein
MIIEIILAFLNIGAMIFNIWIVVRNKKSTGERSPLNILAAILSFSYACYLFYSAFSY